MALSGGGLDAGGGMFCIDGFTADGEVNLISARLGDILSLRGARLDNRGGTALNLERATMGDCDLGDLACTGWMSLVGAGVASRLTLDRGRLDAGEQGKALAADGLTVGGMALLTRLRTQGEVSFRNARFGEGVMLASATLDNPGGVALCLDGAEVAADIGCGGLTVAGEMSLSGAKVAGLRAATVVLRPAASITDLVDLGHAQVDILRDDPALWPERLNLNGLTYRVLEPRLSAQHRLRWLARDPERYEPQPYAQLAVMYAASGQAAEARRVLYFRERQQRATKTLFGKAWSLVQDITVGYG